MFRRQNALICPPKESRKSRVDLEKEVLTPKSMQRLSYCDYHCLPYAKPKMAGLVPPKPGVRYAQTSSRADASEPIASTDLVGIVELTPVLPSAIQGEEQQWWVQLIWAVYYAADTLVLSSIVAVTVI